MLVVGDVARGYVGQMRSPVINCQMYYDSNCWLLGHDCTKIVLAAGLNSTRKPGRGTKNKFKRWTIGEVPSGTQIASCRRLQS